MTIAMRAMDKRIENEARGMRNPMPADTATLYAGMRLYREHCAGCHGVPGKTSMWGEKNLYPPAPQFSEDYDMSPEESFLVVRNGVRYTGMGAWTGMLTDADIWRVVTFLSKSRSLPPEIAAEWKGSGGR